MSRGKVDVCTTEFGIDLEDDVGAVLALGIGNVFHLMVRLNDKGEDTWLH